MLIDFPLVQQCHDMWDPGFDQYGSSMAPSDSPITQEHHDATVDNLVIMSQTMKHHLPDLNALLPNFGWVGKEFIRNTLEKTSQHYQADQHVPMQKHFHSWFSVVNGWHLNEWYSTDTFISDIPAFNDSISRHGRCKMLQVYGDLDSELLEYPP